MRIGVLALQGDFREHIAMLLQLGVKSVTVRSNSDLKNIDGLIIPGGESTTMLTLMYNLNLFQPIKELAEGGMPIMGTCAGMVLLAGEVTNIDMKTLGIMDIRLRRNGFGRQVDSFEMDIPIPTLKGGPFHAIFIRAPLVENVGPRAEVIAGLPEGGAVAVRQDNLLGLAFHPEMTGDIRLHEYFLDIVSSAKMVENKTRWKFGIEVS